MTASKLWGLIFGLAVVGALAVAGAIGRFGDRLPFRSATTDVPAPATGQVATAAPAASKPASPPAVPPAPAAVPSATPPAPPADAAASPPPAPYFDVVRVEPSGDVVLAGKGAPDSRIALLDSGKVVAETRSDADGNFVVLPPPLKPGSYNLSLRESSSGKPDVGSTQSVAVSVPATRGGNVVVSMAQVGKPMPQSALPEASARVAAVPPPAAATSAASQPAPAAAAPASTPATPPKGALAFGSVAREGSGFRSTGTAAPGAHVEVYLNGAHLAGVVAGPDGQWSVAVGQGMTGGHYAVRADEIGRDGAVVARAEVPFDVPATAVGKSPAEPGATAAASPATVASEGKGGAAPPSPGASQSAVAMVLPRVAAAGPGANASIDKVETALVASGDNLWKISRLRFGQGSRYTQIYAANAAQIRDPKLIYPGQVFVVPGK